MQIGQLSLWKYYSFDVIPLDFISSIYEEFVKKEPKQKTNRVGGKQRKSKKRSIDNTVHYTPEYIVDFILDGILPWDGEAWDLKILDPCCGSGIFLVKAFQRLIYRWEKMYSQKINPETLRYLLDENLIGVDIDQEAVRVASFSLYLTMLDSINPLDYWENARFPLLRNRRLIASDFFKEDRVEFSTKSDAEKYDLIIGNAPWGEKTVTSSAKKWADEYSWPISDDNIGTLFLAKATVLTKQDGAISLIQPASTLLSNQLGPAKEFREKLFQEIEVSEVVNLSALRFKIFPNAVSPPCIITGYRTIPDGNPFYYICPKLTETQQDNFRIVIEPQDVNTLYLHEVDENPNIWSTLMWGGRRDLSLIIRLNKFKSFRKIENEKTSVSTQGYFILLVPLILLANEESENQVIKGVFSWVLASLVRMKQLCVSTLGIQKGNKKGDPVYYYEPLLDRKILDSKDFPQGTFLYLSTRLLPKNDNAYAERPRADKFNAFDIPQLIIKRSWQTKHKRFKAAITNLDIAILNQ